MLLVNNIFKEILSLTHLIERVDKKYKIRSLRNCLLKIALEKPIKLIKNQFKKCYKND